MTFQTSTESTSRTGRLHWLDAARGVALVTMASYHFIWDLEYFGYAEPGTAGSTPLRIYAHSIASSFLFLAGVSLFLAHGRGIRWNSFWVRLARIAASAGLITVATWFFMPEEYIYFGILHNIAVASLIGLLFLPVPSALSLGLAAALVAAPYFLRSPLFDTPALYWVGLSDAVRPSNDYVPLIPWFAPFVAGIGVMRFLVRRGRTGWLAGTNANRIAPFRWLTWCGRHSLAFYLAHQPILIALVWCATQVSPPVSPDPAISYIKSCEKACVAQENNTFCAAFCGCTLDALKARNLFDDLRRGALDVNNDDRVLSISRQCTAAAQKTGQ